MEEMVFEDLEPVEIPVKLGTRAFVLREASEDAAVKYRNAAMKAARFADGKVVGVDGAADLEPLLVSLCLFETNPKGNNGERLGPVALGFVRGLPPRVVGPLFDKAKKISHLEDEETLAALRQRLEDTQKRIEELERGDAAKNSPGATAITSA